MHDVPSYGNLSKLLNSFAATLCDPLPGTPSEVHLTKQTGEKIWKCLCGLTVPHIGSRLRRKKLRNDLLRHTLTGTTTKSEIYEDFKYEHKRKTNLNWDKIGGG